MTLPGAVLLTNNIYDYALAISAHRQIAADSGFSNCYPFLISPEQVKAMDPLLNYYGLTIVDFVSLFKGADPVHRSQEIQRSVFRGTTRVTRASSSASPGQLSHSLLLSLREACPLVFDSSDSEPNGIGNDTSAGRSDHLVIANSNSPLAIGAAFYAQATDKQFYLVKDLTEIERTLEDCELSSVMLVDDFPTFTKGFLEQLLHWSLESRHTTVQTSILTAYSMSEFSSLVGRMLVHRDFHRSGKRSVEPEGLERFSLKNMKPVEYYVISEHGNEMHMHHGHYEVICGAFPREHKRNSSLVFDCEVGCPYERVRSNEIPAHNVIILSCNSLTFGDGLVPPEYTVLLNFLNGWPISAIAPFKHVQVNSGIAILVDSLIRSGFSLGEISHRLNCIGQVGAYPDYAYVLVGDPEVVPSASGRYLHPNISVEKYENGVQVKCSPDGKRVMECLVPQEAISHLNGNGHALTFDPVSAELCKQDVFFTFMRVKKARQLGVLVFSEQKLSDAPQSFRLHHAYHLSDAQKHRALDQVRRITNLSIFGLNEIIPQAKDSVLKPLRAMVSYPRPLELALGEAAARNFDVLLNDALLQARRLIIEKIFTILEKSRLWLSHRYGAVYSLHYRLPSESPPARCHTCNRNVYSWRYEDNCTDLPPRTMVLCVRCGIIADTAVPAEIEICLPAFNELTGTSLDQEIIVSNRSDRQIDLSLFVQFNQWKKIGATVDPVIQELNLEPGETVKTEARFIFHGPLPSDIHEMQCYALTDQFDLYCVTQRGLSSQGGAYRMLEDHMSKMHRTHISQHAHLAPQPGASTHANKDQREVSKDTVLSTNGAKKVLVIIEPHAALFRYLEVAQQNYQTLVLSSNPDACLRGELKYNQSMNHVNASRIDHILRCDTGRRESMIEALLPFENEICGVLAGEDSFVPVTAELGEALGFDYTHPSDAICLHLKTAMKQRFADRGVRSPKFVVAKTFDEALAAWEEFDRNCMVKMVDSASSLNIYRVMTRTDLEQAWDTIVNNRKKVVTPIPLAQEVIVEEFIGGRELSAEGYIQDDQVVILNFCEKVTESNFVVVGHYLPADLSSKEEEQLRSIAEKCVREVGLRNSVFHVEVHILNDIPYVIECAGRPPGQHMVELMRRCYGFDLMQISIDIATGKKVSSHSREPQRHFAMLALYSKKAGTLRKIEGLAELHSKGGATHLHVDVKEGDQIQALSTFSDKCGFVILEDESAAGIRQKAAWMKENVHLVVSD